MKNDQTGIENKHVKWKQVKEAVLDYKLYIMFLQGVLCKLLSINFQFTGFDLNADYYRLPDNVPNGGISNFGTIIIKGFGFSTLHTTLLQVRNARKSYFKLSSLINHGLDSIWCIYLPYPTQLRISQLKIPKQTGGLRDSLFVSNSRGRIWDAICSFG
jgi:hypothetical protein